MNITSYTYIVFLAVIAALYYILPSKFQNVLLLAASYAFYMWAAPQNVAVLLAVTAVTYGGAILMDMQKSGAKRKLVCALITVVVLGVLFTFKYYNFFAGLLAGWGLKAAPIPLVSIAGLSFFTFQLVGYCIDVYRKNEKPEKNIIDFALFASFFPQIISGPIGRAGELLPTYKKARNLEYENIRQGVYRFLLGVFRKLVVADGLAAYVDVVYGSLPKGSGLTIWITVVLYALQIYFDFSGYTDIAVGAARIFGIKLRENFFVPYLATSLGGFWSRWHMSLSTWFRDYLYIPLGGNRKGFAAKLLNLLIVFVVSGLWHGAGVTFLLWGLWHGVFRVAEEIVLKIRKRKQFEFKTKLSRVFGVIVTNAVVFFGWVLFRASLMYQVSAVAKNLFVISSPSETVDWIYTVMRSISPNSIVYAKFAFALLVFSVLLAIALDIVMVKKTTGKEREYNPLLALKTPVRAAVCLIMVICLLLIGKFGSSGFIYYTF